MNVPNDLAPAGWAALRASDWRGARTCFMEALQAQDDPSLHDGLGIAFWWLNEVDAAHEQRTAAYLGYKRDGDLARAARLAAWLAREHVFLNGNASAMKGWFSMAERLLSQAGECREQGWFAIYRASMIAGPVELMQASQQTIEIAHRFNDADLEHFARAFDGMARVALGEVPAGMEALDAAMAAVTSGEATDQMVISEVFCVTLSACELAGDLVRTEQWCQVARAYAQRHNCPFLSAYCRTTYGSLLTATGRWQEAESALKEAIRLFEGGHRALRVHALLKLAELYVLEGRLEEAEVLLTGYEDDGAAVMPLARLYLARGEAVLARTLLEQALRDTQTPTLHQVPLLLLLVEATLAMGDLPAARTAAQTLAGLARQTRSDFLLAQAEMVSGKVKQASGEPDAPETYRAALERLRAHEQSLQAARIRLEMAQALRRSDQPGAIIWARAAYSSFVRLGAARDADEARKLLRELGVAIRSAPPALDVLSRREREILELIAHGLTNRDVAERLFLSEKTVEHHVGHILSKLAVRTRAEAVACLSSTPSR